MEKVYEKIHNITAVFGEGYLAGYNQALVDKGFITQEEADRILRGSTPKANKDET